MCLSGPLRKGKISCFIYYSLNKSSHCSVPQRRNLHFICILHTLPFPQPSQRIIQTKTSLVESNYDRLLITKLFQWKPTNWQTYRVNVQPSKLCEGLLCDKDIQWDTNKPVAMFHHPFCNGINHLYTT